MRLRAVSSGVEHYTQCGSVLVAVLWCTGHGSWDSQSGVHHYIHHAKFNWNYGSSPLWDYLCGTTYDASKLASDQQKAMTKLAEEQAILCGSSIYTKDT